MREHVLRALAGDCAQDCRQLSAVLARIPGLVDVHPIALEFIPQIDVQVNLAAAQRYGIAYISPPLLHRPLRPRLSLS